ncbi:MAG: hypothetical protein Q9183_000189 [Haloplaca sp. 2 TL-2023]
MSKLSYGLNITKKGPYSAVKPPPSRRKTVFDEDSGPEDWPDDADQNTESISSFGGLEDPKNCHHSRFRHESHENLSKTFKKPNVSQFGDLSSKRTTTKHAQTAQSLDPSIYEYDAVYDSLHAGSKSSDDSVSASAANGAKKPKYMQSLLAAAEVRKRDQLRAKEKMLAKERELEGDDFAGKEKFVTAAYKRQQEDVRKAEEEEALREREAVERQKRQGVGLKGMYKNMLEKNEEKHAEVVRSVEEARLQGNVGQEQDGGMDKAESVKEKSEVELAKEKGAAVNEEGQVVDKRQLLNAGLNAGSAPKTSATTTAQGPNGRGREGGRRDASKAPDFKDFESRLQGKRGASSEGGDNASDRASKSRKMEDDILASLGL